MKGIVILGYGLLLSVHSALASSAAQPIQVVASIRPLALIASDIAPARVQVTSLVPSWADPHSFQLKVSDVRTLGQASIALWLGREFERFLAKPILNMRPETVLTLTRLPDLRWPVLAGTRATPLSKTSPGHHSHAHNYDNNQDPHIWLDPHNAVAIARAFAEVLARTMPDQAATIKANLSRFETTLERQKNHAASQLAPFKNTGFGVTHDGFNHFVKAFGLTQLAAVQRLPDERLSAKKLFKLQAQLSNAACLIGDANTLANQKLATTLKLPLQVADPLAAQSSVHTYAQFFERLTQAFVACFRSAE